MESRKFKKKIYVGACLVLLCSCFAKFGNNEVNSDNEVMRVGNADDEEWSGVQLWNIDLANADDEEWSGVQLWNISTGEQLA